MSLLRSVDDSCPPPRLSLGSCELVACGPPEAAVDDFGSTQAPDWVEVTTDFLVDGARARLPGDSRWRTIYSPRSRGDGVAREDNDERTARLVSAASIHDLVELDLERDMEAATLAGVPPEQRIVAWYGERTDLGDLRRIARRLMSVPARFYKLVSSAHQPLDGIAPLALLLEHKPGRMIAFSSGAAGAWTRVLSAQFGSPMVYGSHTEGVAEPGAISCERLRTFYGLPDRVPAEIVYGILGGTALSSLAPWLHNRGLLQHGLPAVYLPFEDAPRDVSWVQTFRVRMQEALGLDFRGLTVTAPYKESAERFVCRSCVSDTARRSQAANNLVWRGDRWWADSDGDRIVLEPIRRRGISLQDRRVAVVGCGGAGRAAALGLMRAGAQVTLVNRGRPRGELAARALRLPFVPLSTFSVRDFDVIVHATPVGKHGLDCLFSVDELRENAILLDLVYRKASPTQLVARGRDMGHIAIEGREVLCNSVARQFELLTGKTLPAAALAPILSDSKCSEGRRS